MLYAIVAVLVIIADQWLKFWVAGHIPLGSSGQPFISGILSLVNVHNDGAAFSFLSGGARIYFIVLTGVFVLAVIIALATNFISGRLARWSIVLVAAGGLSNCIDRVIYGYVQDMFKTEFIDFPVFNLADVFITLFCLIFVLAILFERDRDDEDEYDDEYEDDEYEDERPRRLSAKEKRAARAAAKAEAAEAKAEKKARRDREDDEYEQYKAARGAGSKPAASKEEPQPAPRAAARPAAKEPVDPFAEWERANARVSADQSSRPAAMRPAAARPAAPKAEPKAPVQSAPKAPAQPAPKPVSAPKASSSSEDFSLEDILAEFK